ncbi:unnamed protein product [Rangifer tarandus platyrhynchus]|uniref:Uncharacterized protein n=2 Tax=Rangifer tarandus platyrhynchus TaxID=3082113 RepID=A0ACB0F5F6_RANTA|nr:unnamed protein product [Rangifer tarandus platyrhynchus]CAI9708332.1 unnamed protein product [Rangifer tarandus platyrhynchus]
MQSSHKRWGVSRVGKMSLQLRRISGLEQVHSSGTTGQRSRWKRYRLPGNSLKTEGKGRIKDRSRVWGSKPSPRTRMLATGPLRCVLHALCGHTVSGSSPRRVWVRVCSGPAETLVCTPVKSRGAAVAGATSSQKRFRGSGSP